MRVGKNEWTNQQLFELIKSLLAVCGPVKVFCVLASQLVQGMSDGCETLYKVTIIVG